MALRSARAESRAPFRVQGSGVRFWFYRACRVLGIGVVGSVVVLGLVGF